MSDSAEEVNPDVAVERKMNNERARKRRLRLKAEKALKELEAANAGLIGLGVEVKPVKVEIREEEETVQVKETVEEIEIRPEVVQSRLEALGIEAKSKPQVEVEGKGDLSKSSDIQQAAWNEKLEKHSEARCQAHNGRGQQCRKFAIAGATVCRTHGGASRQIKQAARVRIENAADLMARELLSIATGAESETTRLNAVRDALDRSGLGAKTAVSVEVGTPAYLEVFDSIMHQRPQELRPLTQAASALPTAPAELDIVDAEFEPEAPLPPTQRHQDASAVSSRPIYRAKLSQPRTEELSGMGNNGLMSLEDAVGEAARVRPPGPRRRR